MGKFVMIKNFLIPSICGIIFSIGLVLAGMTNPSKVMGFLNIFGNWDPSLIFTMGSAIIIVMSTFYLSVKRMEGPLLNKKEGFNIQIDREIDRSLVIGSTIFGVGWAMVGFCPGPAIAALTLVDGNIFIFFIAMSIGMLLRKVF